MAHCICLFTTHFEILQFPKLFGRGHNFSFACSFQSLIQRFNFDLLPLHFHSFIAMEFLGIVVNDSKYTKQIPNKYKANKTKRNKD